MKVVDLVQAWNPDRRNVHCSNCKFAKVKGNPDDPFVVCAKGVGKPVSLERIIREPHPYGFANARLCPMFSSMSDD